MLESIKNGSLDFAHSNDIWRVLMMPQSEHVNAFPGIEKYLHIPAETNLDAGVYDPQNEWVRFGNRHNDIFPRLGDVIRWKLDLNPRPSVTKAIMEASSEQA